jgi:hypothetical protein
MQHQAERLEVELGVEKVKGWSFEVEPTVAAAVCRTLAEVTWDSITKYMGHSMRPFPLPVPGANQVLRFRSTLDLNLALEEASAITVRAAEAAPLQTPAAAVLPTFWSGWVGSETTEPLTLFEAVEESPPQLLYLNTPQLLQPALELSYTPPWLL